MRLGFWGGHGRVAYRYQWQLAALRRYGDESSSDASRWVRARLRDLRRTDRQRAEILRRYVEREFSR